MTQRSRVHGGAVRPSPGPARGSPSRTGSAPRPPPAARVARRRRRRHVPQRRVDAVGHQVHLLARQLEAAHDLAHHEPRAGDDLAGLVGEPPLDRVDRRPAGPGAGGRRGGRARWRGSWPPAARRTASSACRRPTRPASRGRAPRRAASRRAARPAAPAGGWPTPCGRPGRRRAATAARCRRAARARRRPPRRRASPGWCRLNTTTS